ncbi:MMPL family transporter [Demequina sp.]|uniref:MMPL family transporter n=1 Tax=Demequina sp. TaxID=2050685 RepID=UPI003D115894
MKLSLTGRIARASAARPWLTIGVWVLALAAAIVMSGGLGDALVQDDRNLVTTESDTAEHRAEQLRGNDVPDTELVVVKSAAAVYGDAEFDAAVADAITAVESVDGVAAVSPPAPEAGGVSADGHAAIVTVTLDADAAEETGEAFVAALDNAQPANFQYLPFGEQSAGAAFDALAEDTLMRGEVIGISVALLILVVVFGALVAAGIPLLVALVSITAAIGATAIVGGAFDLSFFIINMITMMGLALGIDYSLVTVQRFREELAHGRTPREAVAIAGNTANRAVLFSGGIVVLSLTGLLLVPSTIMRSLGAGAIIVAIMSVITALTLLPAVLKLLGHRVNKGRLPGAHPGKEPRAWAAIARGVTAKPLLAAVGGLTILVALALPMLSMRLTFPGTDALPEDNTFRQAVDTLVDDFGHGRDETFVVVTNGDVTEVDALATRIEDSAAFTGTQVDWYGESAIITTDNVYDAADERAADAIGTIRTTWVPDAMAGSGSQAYVGGEQAGSVDFTNLIADATPWVLLFVLGTSFVLLLVTFRSVVIAGTAIALNLLSAAAAFGLIVAVFQWGWGADVLGMPQVDGIAPWIPLFLFAVLFGLSMDYHVFLLSRIKERHDAGDDTRTAVIHGLSRTGSLITGAALIMVAVFLGFALGDLAEFAQMGLGLAAAVIIDATVVRTLLVPAIMTLLGNANWYLPTWLDWLPQMHIEAPEHGEPVLATSPQEKVTVPA